MTSANTDPRVAEHEPPAGRSAAVTREVSTARIQPGPGYVARLGNVVVWAEPAPGPSGLDALDALVTGLDDVAALALPGEQATNHVASLLSDARVVTLAGLAAVLPTASGLVALAHGWGAVSGSSDTTTPQDNHGPTVRIIELVDETLVVGRRDITTHLAGNLDSARSTGDRVAPSTRGLIEGVVPGGAAILGTRITIAGSATEPRASYHPPGHPPRSGQPRSVTAQRPFTSEPPPGTTVDPSFAARSSPGPGAGPPFTPPRPEDTAGSPFALLRFEDAAGSPFAPPRPEDAAGSPFAPPPQGVTAEPPFAPDVTDETGRPFPMAPVTPADAPASAGDHPSAAGQGVRVEGIRCIRGHLNNPIWLHCGTCGVSLIKQSSDTEEGIRPPLGRIVFDDGSEFPVDGNFILGAAPERADAVLRGEARGLRVIDAVEGIEPLHTEIRVEGWDVTVIDWSTRGTYLLPEEAEAWQIPPKGVPSPLSPGTHIAIGGRTLVFTPNPQG